ncbi:MAG: TetR/AcrR family transcriptional regulator [Pseudomonadota bacterium]
MPAGRPRTHDPDAIRKGIMQCFWQLGFDRASLPDLEAAAGINRKQLARDYGNKRGLYLQALDDFAVFAGERFVAPLEQTDEGLAAIRQVLLGLAELPQSPNGHLGCLICNASREPMSQTDEDVSKRVHSYFDRIEGGYRNALERADANGEIVPSAEKRQATARLLFAVHVALLVLARGGVERPILRDVAEQALTSLKPAPA